MALKNTSRIGGAVHAVPALELLPDDDCNILVVSSRTLYMLANMAEMEATWHARFAKTVLTGGLVDTVETTDPEADFVDQVIRSFRLEVIPVTCDFSELAAAINNVAAALGNQSGCDCPQQGVVCIDAADIQPDGTQNPPATEGEYGPVGTEYPEGFDSLEDYLAYKCEAANFIMDGLVTLLRTFSPAFLGVATMAVVSSVLAVATSAVGAAVVLPPLAFVAILAAVAGMLFLGAEFYTTLNSLADALEADREEIVCRLYQAQNTTNAINSAIDEIEDVIEAVVLASAIPAPFQGAAQTVLTEVITELWNTSTMNQLFQLVIDISYAGADCSMCGETAPCEWQIAPNAAGVTIPGGGPVGSGTITNDGEEFTLNSVQDAAGIHRLIFMRQAHLSHPDYPAAPTLSTDCDCGDGPYSLTNISGLPSNPTLSSLGCVSGSIGAISWPGTGETSTTAYWMSIARSTGAGGAFSITLRINP